MQYWLNCFIPWSPLSPDGQCPLTSSQQHLSSPELMSQDIFPATGSCIQTTSSDFMRPWKKNKNSTFINHSIRPMESCPNMIYFVYFNPSLSGLNNKNVFCMHGRGSNSSFISLTMFSGPTTKNNNNNNFTIFYTTE